MIASHTLRYRYPSGLPLVFPDLFVPQGGALLLREALWLALLVSVLGLLGTHLLTGLVGWMLQAERSLPVTGWLPVLGAYRVDAGQLLNSR